ncbi:MAG: sigma-70 family RNA polymerase sigma factor [Flavobacteriales bacterium]
MATMAGQSSGIATIVDRYGKSLFGFIRGRVPTDADAEDVVQDVWVQLSSQPEVEAIEQVSGWLHRVARNKITDRYRKKKTLALEDHAYEDEEGGINFREILLAVDDDPDTRMLRDIFWEELSAALDELPEKQRLVFVENELEDRTLQAIADEQGENLKTIISRKRYAVLHLRQRLDTVYRELVGTPQEQ